MSEQLPSQSPPLPTPAEIDASCLLPLLVLFVSGAIWLVIASGLSLIASIKFHSPSFLADCSWLTYGRVWPAALNSMLYGFALQSGLGVGLWLLARLGRATLAQRGLVTVGAAFWNLGTTIGVLAILAGDGTGFQNLEIPGYASVMMVLGYLLIGLWSVLTFHQRRQRALFVSQWFLLAALFWFPWIYSTAELLLLKFPVRGVAQAVIDWWYSDNLLLVWLGLVGLAAVFYFVPKLTNRELHSQYLALFTFWMLILFGSWGGIPASAPVPAWMPALSTAATALLLIPIVAVAVNIYGTLEGKCSRLMAHPALLFIGLGVASFILGGLINPARILLGADLGFTWFSAAMRQLNIYGFFAMTMFGSVYYILPQLTGIEFPRPRLVRAHFWLALLGVVFTVLPLSLGGILEGLRLQRPEIAFSDITKSTLHFLRASTIGDLLLALGHLAFLANLAGLVNRFCRVRAASAYAVATADLFKQAEVKP